AADAALVEAGNAVSVLPHVSDDDARDQKAGDHEEHVHANESAAEQRDARVKENHGKNRNRSQPIDIRTVFEHGWGSLTCGSDRGIRSSTLATASAPRRSTTLIPARYDDHAIRLAALPALALAWETFAMWKPKRTMSESISVSSASTYR